MENKNSDKVAMDIQDSSDVIVKNSRNIGYDQAINAKNVKRLLVDNLESVRYTPHKASPWYRDVRFWITTLLFVVATIIGWVYFSK